MNTSQELIKEVEKLHQQLALTTYAGSVYMDTVGHSLTNNSSATGVNQ